MKAVVVNEGGALSYEDRPDPVAGPGEVVVELKAAAVNRRDLLVRNPPGPAYVFDLPLVPGSDGAGLRRDTGEEVVIYPGLGWGEREDAAGPGWRILGGPDDGTYAELVKVPAENVFPKPTRFSWEEAAAFPLAALTAYVQNGLGYQSKAGRYPGSPGSERLTVGDRAPSHACVEQRHRS